MLQLKKSLASPDFGNWQDTMSLHVTVLFNQLRMPFMFIFAINDSVYSHVTIENWKINSVNFNVWIIQFAVQVFFSTLYLILKHRFSKLVPIEIKETGSQKYIAQSSGIFKAKANVMHVSCFMKNNKRPILCNLPCNRA